MVLFRANGFPTVINHIRGGSNVLTTINRVVAWITVMPIIHHVSSKVFLFTTVAPGVRAYTSETTLTLATIRGIITLGILSVASIGDTTTNASETSPIAVCATIQ